jgi:hypothetical protein
MAGVVRCAMDQEPGSAVQDAAAWVGAFYPDVTCSLDDGAACLTSRDQDDARLRLIWRASLANERLLVRGAVRRAAVLNELVK